MNDDPPGGLDPGERDRLALKGRTLYGKFCAEAGRGTCAEGFARHQIGQGRPQVARDLLAFLESQLLALRVHDPGGTLPMTEQLAGRIRRHLDEIGNSDRPVA
jgi:hypothetical protein